jgi:hypothetical protein
MKTITELLDHKRAQISWVCRPTVDSSGRPCIVRIARIVVVPPADGAGRLYIGVTDWGADSEQPAEQYIGVASGFGYDKRTAALVGAKVGGVELGDHCDHKQRPTLRELCDLNRWEIIGNW